MVLLNSCLSGGECRARLKGIPPDAFADNLFNPPQFDLKKMRMALKDLPPLSAVDKLTKRQRLLIEWVRDQFQLKKENLIKQNDYGEFSQFRVILPKTSRKQK